MITIHAVASPVPLSHVAVTVTEGEAVIDTSSITLRGLIYGLAFNYSRDPRWDRAATAFPPSYTQGLEYDRMSLAKMRELGWRPE